jgi:cation efflux family protein
VLLMDMLPLTGRPAPAPATVGQSCQACGPEAGAGDGGWGRAAGRARLLAWVSLAWMSAEGAVGLVAGLAAGSVALTGWALGSVIEAVASVIVIWRFTGSRTSSEAREQRAGRAVAVSFWLLAAVITADAVRDLVSGARPAESVAGMALTAGSVVIMPVLGLAKHRLGRRLRSGATAGEGTQNLMCAAQAAAVLAGLALTAAWARGWIADPLIAIGIALWSAWEGRQSWRATGCCTPVLPSAGSRGPVPGRLMNVQADAQQDQPPEQDGEDGGEQGLQECHRDVVVFPGHDQADDDVNEDEQASQRDSSHRVKDSVSPHG